MTRKQRAFKALAKRIENRYNMNKKRMQRDADEINEFLKKHGPLDKGDFLWNDPFNHAVDGYALTGAWLYDRIQGKICTTHNKDYKGSLTKKIRNALGYTY